MPKSPAEPAPPDGSPFDRCRSGQVAAAVRANPSIAVVHVRHQPSNRARPRARTPPWPAQSAHALCSLRRRLRRARGRCRWLGPAAAASSSRADDRCARCPAAASTSQPLARPGACCLRASPLPSQRCPAPRPAAGAQGARAARRATCPRSESWCAAPRCCPRAACAARAPARRVPERRVHGASCARPAPFVLQVVTNRAMLF